jgi:hypothetical protein
MSGGTHVLFTATELSLGLSMSRRAFFRYKPKAFIKIDRAHGRVLGFSVETLPANLQARLSRERIAERHNTVEELIRFRQQSKRRQDMLFELSRQRLAPGQRAFDWRQVMNSYFCAVDNGEFEPNARMLAKAKYFEFYRRPCSDRHLRRIIARIEAYGGPDLAPIDAYGDRRSIPHARGGGRKHHVSAVHDRREPPKPNSAQ